MYQKITHITSIIPERKYIPTYFWEAKEPKGIIHIVHGMSEHAERYHEVAHFFQNYHFHVVAHDHLGHGPQAKENQTLGYFSSKDATPLLIEDMYRVKQEISKKNPNLPYFVLAHSMGSFVARLFTQKYSHEISGLLLSGTTSYSPYYTLGHAIAPLFKRYKPKAYNFDIHRRLFQTGLSDAAKDIPEQWISPNENEPIDWPLIGFVFTNNGFAELVKMVDRATQPSWPKKIRRDLPIALFSGVNDPLINGGKGFDQIAKQLKHYGFSNVRFQLFENRGHEIFMYHGKDVVLKNALDWFNLWL